MLHNKTIAVASGKGGTGKTSVAANLARVAADRYGSAAYLDCDVEEPNGGIFLKPRITSERPVCVHVPQVDTTRCVGCGRCSSLCQYSAINHLGGRNVIIFENMCHSCGGCLRICPTGAIKPKQIEIGTIKLGSSGPVDYAAGLLKLGSVRTPSLIREVRRTHAPGKLNIIDAPPGTSCPVIAAITDVDYVILVTEPTPFGLNDLQLAVQMCRKLSIPFGLVINCADDTFAPLTDYVTAENIPLLCEIQYDRQIAQAYSRGEMIVDALAEYRRCFDQMIDSIRKDLARSQAEANA